MKAYKGFDKNMTCRGFQYKEGETYITKEAKLCESGFHACEAPLDCFRYYAPSNSVYHEIELNGITDEKSDDSKKCGSEIKIGAMVDFAGIVKAQFDFVKRNTEPANSATGYGSANSATGYGSANVSTGVECKNEGGFASVNVGWGPKNKCRGKAGSFLVLSEWGDWDGEKYPLKKAVMIQVDGDTIKEDMWYALEDGEIVEKPEE